VTVSDPKQRLTRFTQIYSAERRRAADAGPVAHRDLPLAGELASAHLLQKDDATALTDLRCLYSITTVEELVAIARVDDRRELGLLEGLKLREELVQSLVRAFQDSELVQEELSDWERYESLEYALGCELDLETPPPPEDESLAAGALGAPPPEAAPPLPSPLPASVTWINTHMSPVKDQGARGTCVAFTGVACLEYHLSRFGAQPELDLSEQFAFWNMVDTSGQRNLVALYPLLESDGVCREVTWRYYPKPIAGDVSQGPPPSKAPAEAAAFTAPHVLQLPARSVDTIKRALQQERLVGIGIPVYKSWFESPVVRKYGNITVPIPGEVAEPVGHAVVLVGFQDDPEFAGGGYFIVRNSWDHHWATDSVLGSGYGTIPYRYISHFNWDAWCVKP
jgi:hypothetical protein